MRVSIVVAVADNGVIGRDGQLPWHLPADLQHFKSLTLGKPVLMGRRTWESIGRPLPGRRNIVLSRAPVAEVAGGTSVEGVTSLAEAMARCAAVDELCVIGGADLFRAALPVATLLHLTRVHATVEGDVYFPAYDEREWREVARREHAADERHAFALSFVSFERRA